MADAPRPKRRRRRRGPRAAAALNAPRIRSDLPADAPLTDAEVATMREHLRFLQKHRKALGLSLNAREDLLLQGTAAPEHRGVCLHLLRKVNAAAVQRASERMPDAAARAKFLGGVVRFSDDERVLLAWLESLPQGASRSSAAGALSRALDRLDWSTMSAARMERLLALLAEVFDADHHRADVVFALLHGPSFRATFDEARDRLPRALAAVFDPLAAAYDSLVLGREAAPGPTATGIRMLLAAPDESLRARPAAFRERLLRAALDMRDPDADVDRAAGTLLESLAHEAELYRELGLGRVHELLRRGEDARAKWQLKRLLGRASDFAAAKELNRALTAPRVGRVVLGTPEDWRPRRPGEKRPAPPKGRLRPGYWLDRGVTVDLWTGPTEKAKALAALHRRHPLPGLLPRVADGTEQGKGWVAFAPGGPALDERLGRGPLPRGPRVAADGLRILFALAAAGIRLPDARPKRFVLGQDGLRLWDLTGAQESEGGKVPGGQAAGLVRECLRGSAVSPSLRRLLGRRKPSAAALLAELEAGTP